MTNNRAEGFCNCGEQTHKVDFEDTYDILCPNCNRADFPAEDCISADVKTTEKRKTNLKGPFPKEMMERRAREISMEFDGENLPLNPYPETEIKARKERANPFKLNRFPGLKQVLEHRN